MESGRDLVVPVENSKKNFLLDTKQRFEMMPRF